MLHKSTPQINLEDIPRIVYEALAKYAPDKPTAIFNFNYSSEEESIYILSETNLLQLEKELSSLFKK